MAGVKRTALTMQERLDVLKDLETFSAAAVAEKYNVHRATIFRIRQNAAAIHQFDGESSEAKQRQRVKKVKFEELEKRLLTWFTERRTVGAYISDALLLEKASELNEEFGNSSQFKASRGWLSKFKRRNNIRLVRVYGEKTSADEDGAHRFVTEFRNFMEEEEISPENVYNMDEMELLWKALPFKTEKSFSGHKPQKERLTLGLCTNATGTHKLMPLLIYTFKQPRAIKDIINALPVIFKAQPNAWMTQSIFTDWFDNYFKTSVKQFQFQNGLSGKVILLMGNCANRKLPTNYVQDDEFEIKFLPANTTSLLQPMDQGLIEKFKQSFRHKMARMILMSGGSTADFYKQYNIKHCIEMIDEAWREITNTNIRYAWHKIIGRSQDIEEQGEQEGTEENSIEEIVPCHISEQNEEFEEIDELFNVCKEEERETSAEITDAVESVDEQSAEEKDAERQQQREEQRNEEGGERGQKQEVYYTADQIKKIENIFNCLEEFAVLGPPPIRIHTDALKAHYLSLGEPSSNN